MEYRCCVVDCRSNYARGERTTIFSFPKEESFREIWIKLVNRKDWEPTPSSFICIKHFEEKYYRKGKNDKRYRLTKTLKPVPAIFNPNIQTSKCSSSSHVISAATVPSRSPRKRIYQDDQYQSFMNYNLINKRSDVEEILSPAGSLFKENMTISPSTKLDLVKHVHLKSKNALKLTRLSSSYTTVVSPRH